MEGRKKMAQITRYLTVALALIQGLGMSVGLFRKAVADQSTFSFIVITLILTAGTTFLMKQNIRGRHVFVVQPTCAPTNENLVELLIMVDALKRASAESITAVIPYFGYARQDRRPRSTRVPISAKVVANLLQTVGVASVLLLDRKSVV